MSVCEPGPRWRLAIKNIKNYEKTMVSKTQLNHEFNETLIKSIILFRHRILASSMPRFRSCWLSTPVLDDGCIAFHRWALFFVLSQLSHCWAILIATGLCELCWMN